MIGPLAVPMASVAQAQPFTHQGLLKDGENPANGSAPMTVWLFSVPSGGIAITTVEPVNVLIVNGLFTLELYRKSLLFATDAISEKGKLGLSPVRSAKKCNLIGVDGDKRKGRAKVNAIEPSF
ncbi:MAG: hypothetical protein KatS3mg020_1076 [Fimbriimonadales bacterium]|nr:MAG: hypothetical protein KatS3mg020_1076 [Fimbriimonadales bacterium]